MMHCLIRCFMAFRRDKARAPHKTQKNNEREMRYLHLVLLLFVWWCDEE